MAHDDNMPPTDPMEAWFQMAALGSNLKQFHDHCKTAGFDDAQSIYLTGKMLQAMIMAQRATPPGD
jgi:hypothetical protein